MVTEQYFIENYLISRYKSVA